MVEFALALPLLMLLLIGIIEVSRAVFIYSAVISASREAVRYGSASGYNSNGYPTYQDCAGIRDAAKKVGFLATIEDANIAISYDHGPGTAVFDTCNSSTVDTTVKIKTGDRILVTVIGTYQPIVPLLIPLTNKQISSTSARTMTGIITIHPP